MSTENLNPDGTTAVASGTPPDGNITPDGGTPASGQPSGGTPNPNDQDMVARLVAEKVAEQIKDIKGKLDAAYTTRDQALKKAKELEEADRTAQLKKLEEEGKHKEAYDMKIIAKDAAYNELLNEKQALEQRVLELTRDNQVRDLLRPIEFRNDKANDMAFHEIIGQVVKDDKGNWIHRSGITIKDFISAFVAEEANSFLLKAKASSGGGTQTPTGTPNNQSKSLFAKTQDEVLKLAAEGKLSTQGR